MSADGEVRPVLQQIHGRHPGARVDALTAEESDQGGQRGAGLTAYGKNPEATVPYCWKHSKKENLLRHDSSECTVDQDESVRCVCPCIPL